MAAVIPVVTKISSRVIRILGCNPGPMTLQGTNTYILGTGKRRILLDTGDSGIPQYINHLKVILNSEGIDLAHIFISHWHRDHIGGLNDILKIKENTKHCRVWKYPGSDLDDSHEVEFNFLEDGQEISVEGATVKIISTPGHTSDHIVLLLAEENSLFSADCILGEGTAVFEDLYDYMNSLQKILRIQPTVIYPGHGNIIYNAREKIQFYIDHRIQREQQILDVLKNNPNQVLQEMEFVKIIYKDTPKKMWKAAASNINHHLVKLLKENKVKKIGNFWQYCDLCKI